MRLQGLMFGFCAIAFSTSALAEDRLSALLAYVPADAVGDVMRGDMVSFVDLAALRADSNARTPLFDRFGWSPFEQQAAPLSRLAGGPTMFAEYVQYAAMHQFTSTAAYLGFDWADINAAIGFYQPPDSVTVLVGADPLSDAAAVGTALTGRDFAAEQRGGYPFWWRLEDNALDLANRDPEDPLRGALGGSARAGLVDGAFVTAANWPAIDRALQAHGSESANLAAHPDFMALAYALDQPVTGEGMLLQAVLMAGAVELDDLADAVAGPAATEEVMQAVRARLEAQAAAGGTPRYSALALADRQEGTQALGIVALVYDDAQDAEAAARSVADAFATLDSLATQRPFAAILPGTVATRVISPPGGSRHVALIVFSTELPAPQGPLERPQTAFYTLVNMLYRADLEPLMVGDH